MEDDDERRKLYYLTKEELIQIAEAGALKATETMAKNLFVFVGKSIIEKLFWIVGGMVLAAYFWMQSHGWIK